MATLRDIAALAGVGRSTAGLVLNGRAAELQISETTVQRVREAAEALHYRASHHARALARRRAQTLGLFFNASSAPLNHLGLALANGITEQAKRRGYDVLLFGAGETEHPLDRVTEALADGRVDAALLWDNAGPALKKTAANNWPVVLMLANPAHGCPAVNLDADPGIAEAIRHLKELGHEEVLYLGRLLGKRAAAPERVEAFRTAVKREGLRGREQFIDAPKWAGDVAKQIADYGSALVEQWPAGPLPSAVLCYNDLMALALMMVLNERGVRVPKDVSIIGFDDLFAAAAAPAMTTISHMLPEIGAASVTVALDWLETGQRGKLKHTVPARLVVRNSTAKANAQ